jgi:hypothetical protein
MGVDEELMIVGNEMARVSAVAGARPGVAAPSATDTHSTRRRTP